MGVRDLETPLLKAGFSVMSLFFFSYRVVRRGEDLSSEVECPAETSRYLWPAKQSRVRRTETTKCLFASVSTACKERVG